MPRVDLVAFDMAGTTVRDDGVVPFAYQRAVDPLGIRLTNEEVSAVRGADKREALSRLIRGRLGEEANLAAMVQSAYERFAAALQAAFAEAPLAETPGASELFAWLRERGIRVALTTGYDRRTRDLILQRLGWDERRIDAAVSAEDVARGRPAPYMIFRAMELTGVAAVQRVAVLGDTVVDLQAGVNAGAGFVIGVLGGAHRLDQLAQTRHTHLVERLEALTGLIADESLSRAGRPAGDPRPG